VRLTKVHGFSKMTATALAVCACEAGAPPVEVPAPVKAARPHTIPRAQLPPIDLPVRAIRFDHWEGDYSLTRFTLDEDARTLHAFEGYVNARDKVLELEPSTVASLVALGNAAWREVPSAPITPPEGVREELYIVDRDDAFVLRGYPTFADRPQASDLVLALYLESL
jgi:hypothetical protein